MAGLVAAAEARRLGAQPVVFEKLDRPGGSMRLSSGVVWRHRDFERFRAECPDGDERLQRVLFERLDEDLRWLESLGAPVVERETGNELTTGVRFDVDGLTAALAGVAGDLHVGKPLGAPPGGAPLDPRHRRVRAPSASCCASTSRPRPTSAAARGARRDRRRLRSGSRPAPVRVPASARSTAARCPPRPRARPTGFARRRSCTRATRGSPTSAASATRRNLVGGRHRAWLARQPRARAWFRGPEKHARRRRVREGAWARGRGGRGGGRPWSAMPAA